MKIRGRAVVRSANCARACDELQLQKVRVFNINGGGVQTGSASWDSAPALLFICKFGFLENNKGYVLKLFIQIIENKKTEANE